MQENPDATLSAGNSLGTFIPDFKVTGLTREGIPFGTIGELCVVVDKALPGEVVDIQMIRSHHDRKRLAYGKIISLKKQSEKRIAPGCRHYAYCGGCQWQHLSYTDQLQLKLEVIRQLFAEFEEQNYELRPIIGSKLQFNYRNRITFTFSNRRWMSPEELQDPKTSRTPASGFALKGRHDRVLQIDECHLADSSALTLMHSLKKFSIEQGFSFYDMREERGLLRSLIVRYGNQNEIAATVVFGEEDRTAMNRIEDYFKEQHPGISLFFVLHTTKRGVPQDKPHHFVFGNRKLSYALAGINYELSPQSFFQTNTAQALSLYNVARDFAGLSGGETVYDLYTGVGSIALFIAAKAGKVVGIENSPSAIADAIHNAGLNNCMNTVFHCGDLKSVFTNERMLNDGFPDVIITDPPRSGMHREVIEQVKKSGAKRIVYISCNPVTQWRDIRNLSTVYSLAKLQPVDMFPQTGHIETVALLVLRQ